MSYLEQYQRLYLQALQVIKEKEWEEPYKELVGKMDRIWDRLTRSEQHFIQYVWSMQLYEESIR